MIIRPWTPNVIRPPSPVVDGALRRIRREEQERWRHIRDPRVERTLQFAVTPDTAFEKGASSASPFSFTSSGGDVPGSVGSNVGRVIIGGMSLNTSQALAGTVAMTWDGNALTQIIAGSTDDNAFSSYIFGIKGDGAGQVSTGAKVISGTWSGGGTLSVCLWAVSLYGCDTTVGWQNAATGNGNSTAFAQTIATALGNLIVVSGSDANSAGAATIISGTQAFQERDLDGNYYGGYKASSGVSESVAYTLNSSVRWVAAGVDVIAASGGAVSTPALIVIRQS